MKVSIINSEDVSCEGKGIAIIKRDLGGWRIMLWWYHVVIRADKGVEKEQ